MYYWLFYFHSVERRSYTRHHLKKYRAKIHGPVAQPGRAPVLHTGGPGFKSRRVHQGNGSAGVVKDLEDPFIFINSKK